MVVLSQILNQEFNPLLNCSADNRLLLKILAEDMTNKICCWIMSHQLLDVRIYNLQDHLVDEFLNIT